MVQIRIEIPDEVFEELLTLAEFDGLTQKELVKDAIVLVRIAREAWRNPRKKLVVTDENFEPITEIAPPTQW